MNRNHRVRFSRLSAAELVSRCHTDSERTLALRFISLSVIIELTDAIAQRAVDILTAVPLPTALTAADAIIAATAIEHSLPLYTLDPARFAAVPGLATAQPY
jgi:predicted nucleic acid-binding protein